MNIVGINYKPCGLNDSEELNRAIREFLNLFDKQSDNYETISDFQIDLYLKKKK